MKMPRGLYRNPQVSGTALEEFLSPHTNASKPLFETTCISCNEPLRLVKPAHDMIAVACSKECVKLPPYADIKRSTAPVVPTEQIANPATNSIDSSVAVVVKSKSTSSKPATCPDCNGPSTRGRGWKHNDGCKRLIKPVGNKPATCSGCGGASTRGRGYSHAEGCAVKLAMLNKPKAAGIVNPDLPKCTECGGTKRGRGFKHIGACSLNKSVMAKPKELLERCPECNGTSRGRGFTHVDGCTESTAYKMAVKAGLIKASTNIEVAQTVEVAIAENTESVLATASN